MIPDGIYNIVIGTPFGAWQNDRVEGEPREVGEFYAALLGMQIIRDDWIKVGRDKETTPQLAFGDGWTDGRAPRWGDPERPQQLHLDIFVRDLDAAEKLVLSSGGTSLQDKGDYRTYADPVGHPFCLYRDDRADGDAGVVGRIVIDCISPRSLAAFYGPLLGMDVRVEDEPARVVIARDDGRLPMLAFQQAQFVAPRWPDPDYPAQVHLDLFFSNAAEVKQTAERLGAIPLPAKGGSCAVYADPAGHPFCLCGPMG